MGYYISITGRKNCRRSRKSSKFYKIKHTFHLNMNFTLLLSVLVSSFVSVNSQATYEPPRPTAPPVYRPRPPYTESGYGYEKPEAEIVTVTVTEQVTVTVPSYETATHQVFVTGTRDVVRTETLNTARLFTVEVTGHQVQAGRPRTNTAIARATSQSLLIQTVNGDPRTSEVIVTVVSTAFATTTVVEPTTLRVTHVDVVVEETVVPVLTVVDVEMVETETSTATAIVEVTSTIYHEAPTKYNY